MRNQTIQTCLGVTLKYNYVNGNAQHVNDFKAEVTTAYSGTDTYDIVATYTRSAAACATAGMLLDLGHISTDNYLDLDKPWWNSDIIDKTQTINGNFYFITGDATTALAQMTYCVYFNADEVDRAQQESPYTMVKNNEWTLENMLAMTKGYSQDNGDYGVGVEDNFGVR